MKDILPASVYAAIREHLVARAAVSPDGWEGGSDEEDTLTGDLGGTLRSNWQWIGVPDAGRWSWRVRYKKFRGRGRGAFEKPSGADGILQVEVSRGRTRELKGLLFQAKKIGQANGRLTKQVTLMEELAEGGSAIFVYGPSVYRAIGGRRHLEAPPETHQERNLYQPLGEFLGDAFLPCDIGLRGMYYDAIRGLLVLPNGAAHRVVVRHRITVEVAGPA